MGKIDPKIPIISEETEVPPYDERKNWRHFWLVDPLDGTKEFLRGAGEFTVNIALIEERNPILGVIYEPVSRVCYFAQKEHGSWKAEGDHQPKRIYSQPCKAGQPKTVVESRSHPSQELEDYLKTIPVKERIKVGSSLKFGYLAEGKANLYARFVPSQEWDMAAGDCIFRYSAKSGENPSPLTYNKPDLHNGPFVIGPRPY